MELLNQSKSSAIKLRNEKVIYINQTEKEIADLKSQWENKISDLLNAKGNIEEYQVEIFKQKKTELTSELK